MKSKETLEDIEKMAMDSLKDKWSHLYQFGYPTRPFPTNYHNDLNCVMLGLMLAHSLKLEEDNADKKYTEEDLMSAFNAGINNDYGNGGPSFDKWLNSLNKQD